MDSFLSQAIKRSKEERCNLKLLPIGFSLCTVCFENLEKFIESFNSWIRTVPYYKKDNIPIEINIANNGMIPSVVDYLDQISNKYSFVNVFFSLKTLVQPPL